MHRVTPGHYFSVTIDLNVFRLERKVSPGSLVPGRCSTVIFMGGNNMSYSGRAAGSRKWLAELGHGWERDNGAGI